MNGRVLRQIRWAGFAIFWGMFSLGFATRAQAIVIDVVWNGPANGSWNVPGNWLPVGVPNNGANTYRVTIGPGVTVQLDLNATIDRLQLGLGSTIEIDQVTPHTLSVVEADGLNSDGTIRVKNANNALSARGLVQNSGEIRLEVDSSGNADFVPGTGGATLTNGGTLLLQSSNFARLLGSVDPITNGAAHTIRGAGRVQGAFTNNGVVRADTNGGTIEFDSVSTKINTNLIEADLAGQLRVIGTLQQSGGGTLRVAHLGSEIELALSTGRVEGGLLQQTAGRFRLNQSAILKDVTIQGELLVEAKTPGFGFGRGLIEGVITNNGTVRLTGNNEPSSLIANATATLTGTGRVELELASATVDAIPKLTQAVNHTIEGVGSIKANIENHGIIRAMPSLGYDELLIDGTKSFLNAPAGRLEGFTGATLQIDRPLTNRGRITATDAGNVDINADVSDDDSGTTSFLIAQRGGVTNTRGRRVFADCIDVPPGVGSQRASHNFSDGAEAEGKMLWLRANGDFVLDSGSTALFENWVWLYDPAWTGVVPKVDIRAGCEFSLEPDAAYTQQAGETWVRANGTLTLGDAPLDLQGGTLKGAGTINGSVNNTGGIVDPGDSPGTLTINGDYTQGADGKLRVEIAAGGQFDRLDISGFATLGGELEIVLNGYTPGINQTFSNFITYDAGAQLCFARVTNGDGYCFEIVCGAFAADLVAKGYGGSVLHVRADAPPNGNGASWQTAFNDLQTALTNATNCAESEEIWVAQGIYKPTSGTDRAATFQLLDGVALYGGFAGTETDLSQRQIDPQTGRPVLHSILNGDLNADDGDPPDYGNYGENSYHVVTGSGASNMAILDGFTIDGGYANGSAFPDNHSGGVLIQSGSPKIRKCLMRRNRALSGGAMLIEGAGSNPTIEGCLFFDNIAGNNGGAINVSTQAMAAIIETDFENNGALTREGGAVSVAGSSSVAFADCTFVGNNAVAASGGAVDYGDGSASFTRCVFVDNHAAGDGGAIFNYAQSEVTLTDCEFLGNLAGNRGGCIYSEPAGGPYGVTLFNCTLQENNAGESGALFNNGGHAAAAACRFLRNHSGSAGGAITNTNDVTSTFVNCVFAANTAQTDGGAVFGNAQSDSTFVNCVFSDNIAGRWGGGLYSEDTGGAASATFYDCTFSANAAGADGGGLYGYASASHVVRNCVFGGNQPSWSGGNSPTATYSCINSAYPGVGNIVAADPLFVNSNDPDGPDNAFGTSDDGLRLQSGSPCIDAGNNNDVPLGVTTDLAGQPRFADGPSYCELGNGTSPLVDMGAYEAAAGPDLGNRLYVNAGAPPGGNGAAWATAFTRLQDALAVAARCSNISEVWVAEGTYKPTSGTDRTATFQPLNGVALYGGFDGTETDLAQRQIDPQTGRPVLASILSGDLLGDDNPNDPFDPLKIDDNSFHVVTGSGKTMTAILDGLTIRSGNANSAGGGFTGLGGGLFADSGSPTLRRCTFTACFGDAGGGMMLMNLSAPLLEDCLFEGNHSPANGGGADISVSAAPVLRRCVFKSNSTGSTNQVGGGALHLARTTALLEDCVFEDNSSGWNGGAIYMDGIGGTHPILTRCRFERNTGQANGGAIYLFNGAALALERCDFNNNLTSGEGGAIRGQNVAVTAVACRFLDNSAWLGGGLYHNACAASYVNCLFGGNTSGNVGGAMYNTNADPVLTNCTIVANISGGGAGGINDAGGSDPILTNCIVWGNNNDQISGGAEIVNYSNVQGGWTGAGGTGNLNAPPNFVDPDGPDNDPDTWADNDYRPAPGSVCIDAGNNNVVPGGVTTDLAGQPRFADAPATPDTGLGTPPLVDMGAYEFQPPPPLLADLNCDGAVDFFDIDAFILALLDAGGYAAQYPNCDIAAADVNGDGAVDFFDIDPFIACVLNGGCP